MKKVIVLMPKEEINKVFSEGAKKKLENICSVNWCEFEEKVSWNIPELISSFNIIILGHGSPYLKVDHLRSSNVEIIIHSRGSIRPYIDFSIFDLGIIITSNSFVIAPYVAEYTLGLMINASRRTYLHSKYIKEGFWKSNKVDPTTSIFGKKIGIVGFGNVGKELYKLLAPFNNQLFVYDPYVELNRFNVIKSSLEEIFSCCDIITIHAGLTDETIGFINRKHFKLMRDNAILINTARGSIIKTNDLMACLPEKQIYLLLDVFDSEPINENYPLVHYEKAFLTPHIAGPSDDSLFELGEASIKNVEFFLKGGNLKGLLSKEKALRAT